MSPLRGGLVRHQDSTQRSRVKVIRRRESFHWTDAKILPTGLRESFCELFCFHYGFGRVHVFEAVVGANYDDVLLRDSIARERESEVITLGFRIRQAADRFHVMPVARIEGILCPRNRREAVN